MTPVASAPDPLTEVAYMAMAHATLARIEQIVDAWLQDDTIDIDAQRTGGMLELAFPNGSKIVVNTQPPLRELWMASRAAGQHFRLVAGRWLDTRDGSEFFAALSLQATAQGGQPLQFSPTV